MKGLCEKAFMLGAQRKYNCSIISKFLAERESSSFSNVNVSVYRTKTDIFRCFPTKSAFVIIADVHINSHLYYIIINI